MAKRFVKVADRSEKMQSIKRRIDNALASEKAQGLADALRALIDELETTEVEVDEKEFADKVKELIANMEDVPEVVAEAIAKRVQAVQNSIKPNERITAAVKNQISAAILTASDKASVRDAVEKVLAKNGISGLSFEESVDYTIVENWGDLNPLFAQLKRTYYTKFHYNDDELATAAILAKQWDKTSEAEKAVQQVAVSGKTINTDYIYKRQTLAQADLDDIEKAGESTNFMRWLNEELDKQIVNSIILAILRGDDINPVGSRITTFEAIGTKTQNDVFTSVAHPAVANDVTLKDVRLMCDLVQNPYGKKKVLIVTPATLTKIAEFTFGAGGSVSYKGEDELAKMLGVDEIIRIDSLASATGLHAVCMLPEGYWYNEKNAISVSYPEYKRNEINFQKERNVGGAIHDLYSTAVLKEA